jgi:hypothetical protein
MNKSKDSEADASWLHIPPYHSLLCDLSHNLSVPHFSSSVNQDVEAVSGGLLVGCNFFLDVKL